MRTMALIGAGFGIFLNILLLFHFISFDGLLGNLVLWVGGNDSVYAEDYTTIGFWRIREGDSHQRVLELIGAPLEVSPDDKTLYCPQYGAYSWWRYTRADPKGNYSIRWLRMDPSGHVLYKVSELYVD